MDASIYDDENQLFIILKGVFAAGNNEAVKQTQDALNFMAQDPIRLVDTMTKILINENTDSINFVP